LESIEGQEKDVIPAQRYMERLNNALAAQHKYLNDKDEPLNPIRELPQWYKKFDNMKILVEYQENLLSKPHSNN
jgi:hypothetical protein